MNWLMKVKRMSSVGDSEHLFDPMRHEHDTKTLGLQLHAGSSGSGSGAKAGRANEPLRCSAQFRAAYLPWSPGLGARASSTRRCSKKRTNWQQIAKRE